MTLGKGKAFKSLPLPQCHTIAQADVPFRRKNRPKPRWAWARRRGADQHPKWNRHLQDQEDGIKVALKVFGT